MLMPWCVFYLKRPQQPYFMNFLPLLSNVSSFSLHRAAPPAPSLFSICSSRCLSTALRRLLLPRAWGIPMLPNPMVTSLLFSHLTSWQHLLQWMKFLEKFSLVNFLLYHILLAFLLFCGHLLFFKALSRYNSHTWIHSSFRFSI